MDTRKGIREVDGEWWYYTPAGHRARAKLASCATCGTTFPTHPSSKEEYCSVGCRRRPCVRCGTAFQPRSNRSHYCSPECKMGERPCEQCGEVFIPKKNTARRFCSTSCFYEFTVPVGSKHVQPDGYVIQKVPPGTLGSKRAGNRQHWMLEHRYVMQQQLGRPLEPHEQVHHKNGVRDDNRPENLELWKRSHPEGVRSKDYHCAGCRCAE